MDDKNIVMILGPGRSGTSMLTNILLALGMSGSSDMIGTSEANPKGAFEDKEIFQLQRDIFNVLNLPGYAPVPHDFVNDSNIKKYIPLLKEIILERIKTTKGVWGFKDPKTASLLPLWSKVLNPIKVTPAYVLAIRDPSAVVLSMNKYYNDDMDIAELAWLIRTCDALYHSGGNCFIVHYEDWFTDKANPLVSDLANFIGLGINNKNTEGILSGIVEKSLNRSSYEKHELKNPFVKRLYGELLKCSGDQFDHERLMEVVVECRQAIKSFLFLVPLTLKKNNNGNEGKEIERLKNENKEVTSQTKEQQEEIKKLKDNDLKNESHIREQSGEIGRLKNENKEVTSQTKEQQEEINKLKDNDLKTNVQIQEQLNKIVELKNDNFELVSKGNAQLQEIQKLSDDNQDLNIKVFSFIRQMKELEKGNQNKKNRIEELQEKNKNMNERIEELNNRSRNKDNKLQHFEKEVFKTRTSVSYKIGQTFVNAVKSPGKNTILFPLNFLKVILEAIFVSKHLKK